MKNEIVAFFSEQWLPLVLGGALSLTNLLILLLKTRISNIVKRLNKSDKVIERSRVSDPEGYYSSLEGFVVLKNGEKIPLGEVLIVPAKGEAVKVEPQRADRKTLTGDSLPDTFYVSKNSFFEPANRKVGE